MSHLASECRSEHGRLDFDRRVLGLRVLDPTVHHRDADRAVEDRDQERDLLARGAVDANRLREQFLGALVTAA